MNERLNKPRIFLSHSKKDADLIRRLYDDLRQCQIEPWIDEMDIRPGKPWLDAIFEKGIPTCDCVFIYLTEHSVGSAMVKKELDAAVLGQLEDNKISLLPYVSTATVRASLRADIRGLQIPVLDMSNYTQVLPKLVSEVWRSFLERTVEVAVQRERVKRLEAELELEKISKASNDGVFTDAEEREFSYIAQQLSREEIVEFTEEKYDNARNKERLRIIYFNISVLSLLSEIAGSRYYECSDGILINRINELLECKIPNIKKERNIYISISRYPDIMDELLRYGLVTRSIVENKQISGMKRTMLFHSAYHLIYTDRLERFKYWLTSKGMMPDGLIWSLIKIEEISSKNNTVPESQP